MRVALGIVAGTTGGPRSYGIGLVSALAAEFPGDEWFVLTDRPADFAGIPLAGCERVRLLTTSVSAGSFIGSPPEAYLTGLEEFSAEKR